MSRDQYGNTVITPLLGVLSSALNVLACNGYSLVDKIKEVFNYTATSPRFVDFGKAPCNQIHLVDADIYYLKDCLGDSLEHSIEGFCNGDMDDLMEAPLLQDNCVSAKTMAQMKDGQALTILVMLVLVMTTRRQQDRQGYLMLQRQSPRILRDRQRRLHRHM